MKAPNSMAADNKLTLPLYGITIFLSAALMFCVEPMIGKMLLPIVGGTPSGWIVAMAFFQLSFLAGYLLAHMLSKLASALHGLIFIGALALASFFLPINLSAPMFPLDIQPTPLGIFTLLVATAAVPFIALSAAAPTWQRLFAGTGHKHAKDPYFLYAASNLGSFVGLFSYPLAVEPFLGLSTQTTWWKYAFCGMIMLGLACLSLTAKSKSASADKSTSPSVEYQKINWPRRFKWLLLSFVPSSLMLGVTTHLTSEVLSAPMIWVLPLATYLLTFIIVFSPSNPFKLTDLSRWHPVAVMLAICYTVFMPPAYQTFSVLALHLLTFGLTAMLCHQQLAQDRPPAGNLTEYYLVLAIGGAMGGMVNAFIAPFIFNGAYEYLAVLAVALICNPIFMQKFGKNHRDWVLIGAFCLGGYFIAGITGAVSPVHPFMLCLLIMSIVLFSVHPRMALLCSLLSIAFLVYLKHMNTDFQERNFYGIIRVFNGKTMYDGKEHAARFISHGTTTHGLQITDDPALECAPTTYYGAVKPLIDATDAKNIGVIGLGAGTIAAYGAPDRSFTYFEIDPVFEKVAREKFTFISKCANDKVKVYIGDGRLELAKTADKYDLLVLDAFSSDVVPTHLLTVEALNLYLDHVSDNGVVALHLSNRFFDLEKVAASISYAAGVPHKYRLNSDAGTKSSFKSKWVVISRTPQSLERFSEKDGWQSLPANSVRPWTDNYSNFLSVIKM